MNAAATAPASPLAAPTATLTLDELVATRLTARELDVIAAYQALCGGSILSWAAKMGGAGL